MNGMNEVSVAKIAELLDLKCLTPNIDLKAKKITSSDINRPALPLAGYFEHFAEDRVQIIGQAEHAYAQQMSDSEKLVRYDILMKF